MFKRFFIRLILALTLVLVVDILLFKNLRKQMAVKNIELPNITRLIPGRYVAPESTIIITGDIMLGRSVMETSLIKNDPNYPFKKVTDALKRANIVFGNLENPVIANCPQSKSGLKFCADPRMISGLKYANINIVNLGNNHAKNYGENGLKQTENFLSNAGIDYVGADNLVIKEINGTKFGFLGFDFVTKEPKSLDFQLVRESKKKTDVLIVMVHWGIEYSPSPTEDQKTTARDLVYAGADVVVGSHPHWVQNIDFIDGKPVFYSLGNFVFDQAWSEETKNGLAIRLTYDRNNLLKAEKLPIYMNNFVQPEWSGTSETISQ